MRVLPRLAAVLLVATLPSFASTHGHHSRTSASIRHASSRHASHAIVMDPARATEIQAALIRQGYLSGEPTGVWDSQSVAAMQKLQAANGWQTKITPDSRALIKLGLGGGSTSIATAVAPTVPGDGQ